MESAEKPIQDLHAKVSESLVEAGHKTATPQSVNPNDESALNNLREMIGDVKHDTGAVVTSTVNTGEEAKIRIARESPTLITTGRWLKKNLLRKAA